MCLTNKKDIVNLICLPPWLPVLQNKDYPKYSHKVFLLTGAQSLKARHQIFVTAKAISLLAMSLIIIFILSLHIFPNFIFFCYKCDISQRFLYQFQIH